MSLFLQFLFCGLHSRAAREKIETDSNPVLLATLSLQKQPDVLFLSSILHTLLCRGQPHFLFFHVLLKKKRAGDAIEGGGDRFFFKRYKTVKYHSERKNTKKKWDQEIDIIIRYL